MTSDRAGGPDRVRRGDAPTVGTAGRDDGEGAGTRTGDDDRGRSRPQAIEPRGLSYDLGTYAQLLRGLVHADYEFVGFDGPLGPREVALRHDVDLSIERATIMADLEATLGVQSTYCFLVTAPVYDLLLPEHRRRLESILDAGHDVGLHFDPHRYWDDEPDPDEVEAEVAAELASLERAVDTDVEVVSFHVPPDWALATAYDGFESTYRPRYFEDVTYVSDSSQKWVGKHPFAESVPRSMQLLVHPGLWHRTHRPMAEIVADRRDRCTRRIREYLDPLGD